MRLNTDEALALSKELAQDVRHRAVWNAQEGEAHRPCRMCPWVPITGHSVNPDLEERVSVSLGYLWRLS